MKNWYQNSKLERTSGNNLLNLAVMAVIGGAALWWASQEYDIPEPLLAQEVERFQAEQTAQEPVNTRATTNTAILDNQLVDDFRRLEGNRAYQEHLGHFRNGRFFPYTDTRGFQTVGYGHRIRNGEDYSEGIPLRDADILLRTDAQTAIDQANELLANVQITQEAAQIIANMVFQMGAQGVSNFTNMWEALSNQDYDRAANEMLDSRWNQQTPNRARELADRMRRQ